MHSTTSSYFYKYKCIWFLENLDETNYRFFCLKDRNYNRLDVWRWMEEALDHMTNQLSGWFIKTTFEVIFMILWNKIK